MAPRLELTASAKRTKVAGKQPMEGACGSIWEISVETVHKHGAGNSGKSVLGERG